MQNRGRVFWLSTGILLASLVILFFAAKNILQNNVHEEEIAGQPLPAEVNENKQDLNLPKIVLAYYAPASEASFNSLKKNLKTADVVIGMFGKVSADGSIVDSNSDSAKVASEYVRKNSGAKIWALINNYDRGWQSERTARMFNDVGSETNFLNSVHEYVLQNKFDGLSLDFESLPASAKADFPKFLAKLSSAFVGDNVKISVNVPADDANYDYAGIAEYSDYVIVMAYDEHYSVTPPGPIASMGWFKKNLSSLSSQIPPEKLIVGLGNYAYDWTLGGAGTSLTSPSASAIAKQKNLNLFTDTESLNSHFTYNDAAGRKHEVWLLDSVSVGYELDALKEFGYTGIALFRFGSEDPYVWDVLERSKSAND